MKILFVLRSFWDNKSLFEKIFWVLFFTFVALALFYILNLENLKKYYFFMQQKSQIKERALQDFVEDKQKLFYTPLEMMQSVLRQSKTLNISYFDIFNNEITIVGEGNFDDVMRLVYFIESFAQNFILDFYFYSANPFDFKIVFISKEG